MQDIDVRTGQPEMIIDLHEDVADYCMIKAGTEDDFSRDVERRQADLPKYRKAGIAIVVCSLFPLTRTWNPQLSSRLAAGYGEGAQRAYIASNPQGIALEQLKIYYRMLGAFPNSLRIVQQRVDLEEAVNRRKLGFLICLEGTEALEDVSDLEVFSRLGLRAVGLTWNYDTRYASSCMTKKDYGLTSEGERLVREANERGIIIDLAHSSKKTMQDVLAISKQPVMISHANYAPMNPHARNVDEEVLEGVCENGGVMGFTMITSTIGPTPDLDTLAKHILSVQERFGSDIIAIGTDYLGIERTPRGLENVTTLPALLTRLAVLGMKNDELSKLAHQNAYRLIENNAQAWR